MQEITLRRNVQPAQAFIIEDTNFDYTVVSTPGSCDDALKDIHEAGMTLSAKGKTIQRILSAYHVASYPSPTAETEEEYVMCEIVWSASGEHWNEPMISYLVARKTLDEVGFSDPSLTSGTSSLRA